MKFKRFIASLALMSACPLAAHAELRSTPTDAFRVPEGFAVELVYEVPMDSQGSWVAMAVDHDGSLIVSDQYGGLYRVELPSEESASKAVVVTPIASSVGMVQGICPTDHGLYVNINGNSAEGSGTYRLQDLDNDGMYESAKRIIPMSGTSEHGPHAIIKGPDGRLYTCSGNDSEIPEVITRSRVPKLWGNDHMLGRMPDARGFMANRMGPGGFVLAFNEDASDVELIALGFRNEYDIAFNKAGDLFTYDADMEWDVGTPWYRPTRVNHVVSGVDFGWRNGTGKYPDYFADSFGSVVDIGYGSPTGIAFAYETNFPEPYRSSLLISDWSYGVIYAVQMDSNGGTYTGQSTSFISAAPMPVTDVVARPQDGSLYVSVGGRRVQSALYRVKYVGSQETATTHIVESLPIEAQTRRELEKYHKPADANAINLALQHVGSSDRSVRSAARIVLEHQSPSDWREQALKLTEPQARISVAVGLALAGDASDQDALVKSLASIDWRSLDTTQRLELIRAYQLIALRLGGFSDQNRTAVIEHLNAHFPDENNANLVNRELARLLLHVNAPEATARTVQLLRNSGAADDQIHYALCLREIEQGWTSELRKQYFQWFFDIAQARGGASFGGFIDNIRKVAIEKLDDATKKEMGQLIEAIPAPIDPSAELQARQLVKEWTVDGLVAEKIGEQSANFENGKKMFAVAQCFKCHRFAGLGGIQGPDLTGAGGRFNSRDLLTAIVEPSKEISDQYQATIFLTEDDQIVTGRVANLNGNNLSIATNMLDPGNFTNVDRRKIVESKPSPVSMMPSGLLNTLTAAEVNDLVTYLRSGGNPNSPLYKK